MTRFFVLFFIFLVDVSLAQRAEIIQRTSFSHDYVVGYSYYVEDNIDTARLFFLGIVKTVSSNRDDFASSVISRLNSKTKDLNGNAYKLKTFEMKDTTLTMFFDIYFAPEKHIDLMKINAVKEKIIIFNNTKDTSQRKLVINNKSYYFPRNKHFEIFTYNKDINLKLEVDSSFSGTTENISKNKKALFLSIKKKNTDTPVLIGGAIGGLVGAVIAKEISEGYPRNNPDNEVFSQLNYNTGRILMNIYQLDKLISIN